MPNMDNTEVQLIQSKLDLMLTKSDYLVEHSKLESRVAKLEERSIVSMQWANDEHAAIRKELADSYKELTKLMNSVKDDINNDRSSTFRWAIGILLSFLGGGGIASVLIEILRGWHP